MPTMLGSIRRLMLTPSLAEVSFAGRGFPVAPTDATRRLEAVPQAVICGFEWGIDARDQWELERRLSLIEPEQRGFAYEGATMAYTILDAMKGGRGHRARDLLRGPGEPHIFLTYIGIGFAMARLPRPLWKRVSPDLTGSLYYPTMSWLAVDGYGFDRAYFDTQRWIREQRRPQPYPWLGAPGYFNRAIDQGIGRALWFMHGGQVADVGTAVARFASSRRADLWSGVGLASTFAGGCSGDELAILRRLAREQGGEYEAHLAQGSVFAAKARSYAGFIPPHSETASRALSGLAVADAAMLANEAVRTRGDGDAETPYEGWRRLIRERFLRSSAAPASSRAG